MLTFRSFVVSCAACILVIAAQGAPAQEAQAEVEVPAHEAVVETAPVMLDGEALFSVRAVSALPAIASASTLFGRRHVNEYPDRSTRTGSGSSAVPAISAIPASSRQDDRNCRSSPHTVHEVKQSNSSPKLAARNENSSPSLCPRES